MITTCAYNTKVYMALQCLFVTLLMGQSILLTMGLFYGLSELDAVKAQKMVQLWEHLKENFKSIVSRKDFADLYEKEALPLQESFQTFRRVIISATTVGILLLLGVFYAALVEFWPIIMGYAVLVIGILGSAKYAHDTITGVGYLIGTLSSISTIQIPVSICLALAIRSHKDAEAAHAMGIYAAPSNGQPRTSVW